MFERCALLRKLLDFVGVTRVDLFLLIQELITTTADEFCEQIKR